MRISGIFFGLDLEIWFINFFNVLVACYHNEKPDSLPSFVFMFLSFFHFSGDEALCLLPVDIEPCVAFRWQRF